MAESDFMSLRESPSDQYDIVQQLYVELEQEREASATAANEALSMILRLQGEKAAEKMEACQYRRMAEEKIHHTEESLAIFEEILYQKDTEITFLKFQLQVYRDRLSKSGWSSPNVLDLDSLETLSFSGTNVSMDNMNFYETMRRYFTLPAMRSAGNCNEMGITEKKVHSPLKRSEPRYLDKLTNTMDDQENAGVLYNTLSDLSRESPVSDSIFLCDQVDGKSITIKVTSNTRKIEENLESDRALAHNEFQMSLPIDSLTSGLGNSPCYSTTSNNPFCDSTVEVTETVLGSEGISSSSHSEYLENFQDFEIELPVNKICPVKFYDIFEVPQCAEDSNSGPENKVFKDCISERKDVSLTTHKVPKENKDYLKDEEWLNKALLDDQYRTLLSAPRKGNCQDYNRACKNHKSVLSCCQNVEGLWQSEIRQLKMWLQVLEEDRRIIKQEDSNRGEQLKLLREISQQLSMLCSNSKISPLKKHCHEDDTSVISFMEVKWHSWGATCTYWSLVDTGNFPLPSSFEGCLFIYLLTLYCGACQPACQAEVRVCVMQRKYFYISVKRMGAPCFDLNFFDSVPFNHQAIGVACAGPLSPSIGIDVTFTSS